MRAAPVPESPEVQAWWEGLGSTTRRELTRMWDPRAESVGQAPPDSPAAGAWQTLPIELYGEIVDAEEAVEADMAYAHLFEYLIGNPDLQFFLAERTFHICRAHEEARAVVAGGLIPAEFRCPRLRGDCPMRDIVAQAHGGSVRLRVRSTG